MKSYIARPVPRGVQVSSVVPAPFEIIYLFIVLANKSRHSET